MPLPALALLRHRLTPPAFDRAVGVAELFDPESAVTAGFLDRVVDPDEVVATAQEIATSFLTPDPAAHEASKLRARATVLAELRAGIDAELATAIA